MKEAKIIAMTCTHAALKRRDLVELGFKVKKARMIGFQFTDLVILFLLSFINYATYARAQDEIFKGTVSWSITWWSGLGRV